MVTTSEKSRDMQQEDHMLQLERAIAELGAAILKLKNEHQAEDAVITSELERRYAVLKKEYDEFKIAESSSSDISGKAAEAWEGAKSRFSGAYNDFRDYATDEKTSEQWKKGAKDVGEGFSKAWSQLSTSFERAYQRVQERKTNTPDKN